jgi:hypothetical protein
MSYGLDGWGSIPGKRQEIFLHFKASRPALGHIHPPKQWVPGALPRG